jgi:hypothetical protein
LRIDADPFAGLSSMRAYAGDELDDTEGWVEELA